MNEGKAYAIPSRSDAVENLLCNDGCFAGLPCTESPKCALVCKNCSSDCAIGQFHGSTSEHPFMCCTALRSQHMLSLHGLICAYQLVVGGPVVASND